MSLLERFADPGIIDTMSFGEKMLASSYVAILGMGITFLALVILWVAIAVMSRVIAGFENKNKAALTVAQAPAPSPVSEPVKADAEADDLELVAVITAAIAAVTQQPLSRIQVRSIRRTDPTQPAWQRAGIQRQVSKRM